MGGDDVRKCLLCGIDVCKLGRWFVIFAAQQTAQTVLELPECNPDADQAKNRKRWGCE